MFQSRCLRSATKTSPGIPDGLPVSARSEPPPSAPPPPDGGYGWICVLAQFIVNGFTWGVAASYSLFLAYYLSHDLFAEAHDLDYALIGGLNFAAALFVAPLAVLLARHHGVRAPMLAGSVVLSGGFLAASFASKVWHLYLSQGMCVGMGIGLVYIPATAVIPQWFDKKRSLANGICAAGSGIGGLIICFSEQAMLDAMGLVWALRITALIVLFANLAATLLMRSRDHEVQPHRRTFHLRLLALYQVQLLLGWSIILMFGYITLMFSLSDYALVIGRSQQDGAIVAAMLNLGTALGRPFVGYASDKLGRVEVAGVSTFTCGVLVLSMWLPSTNFGALIAFAIISGAILGIFWVVIGPLATEIVGLKELPALLNMTWLAVSVPSLFAEVIALRLRRPEKGARSYLDAQIFAGASYLLSSLLLLELWRVRRKGSQKRARS
ncbi:hypothetical protein LMH87_005289 [Akanthomyces muscarius]|uniref:Major facilitator superfamily (MFS) profile domain-containing protein n=1 Tax=Akanthomyces muscarius TaxID=2231603 RepID=A0A9W8URU5_AKAMU|nr:hypothetical protein LMH87_005289 [Akanthomyces muscarius]KAJ4163568.1 hypothetical protein LMH87_005289 [Akanthomyces muscarius]